MFVDKTRTRFSSRRVSEIGPVGLDGHLNFVLVHRTKAEDNYFNGTHKSRRGLLHYTFERYNNLYTRYSDHFNGSIARARDEFGSPLDDLLSRGPTTDASETGSRRHPVVERFAFSRNITPFAIFLSSFLLAFHPARKIARTRPAKYSRHYIRVHGKYIFPVIMLRL